MMSKQSAVAIVLIAVALALQMLCSWAGIDGDLHTLLAGLLDAGIGALGLNGLRIALKSQKTDDPGVQ